MGMVPKDVLDRPDWWVRTCGPDGETQWDFRWPLQVGATVEAPDWQATNECGRGLHGLPRMEGRWDLLSWAPGDVAVIFAPHATDQVAITTDKGGKSKTREATVLWVGPATESLCDLACAVMAAAASSGDGACQASSGDDSRLASSGAYSRLASSGAYSRLASSGDDSRLASSGAYSCLASSGDDSCLASSGAYSRLASSGAYSRLASSGDDSCLASSGDGACLASSGAHACLASSGAHACAKAGPNGAIALAYHDGRRKRFVVGYVGEDGIMPGVWYVVRNGRLVPCVNQRD